MLSNKPLVSKYSSTHEGIMTIYMAAPTGRLVMQATLAREFNRNFFSWIVSRFTPERAFFFKDRTDAENYHLIHCKAGLYELHLPKTAYLGDKPATQEGEVNQVKIDLSKVTLESIQNVTVIETPTYKRFTISNPHAKGTETPVIEIGSPPNFEVLKNKK